MTAKPAFLVPRRKLPCCHCAGGPVAKVIYLMLSSVFTEQVGVLCLST